MRKLLLYIYNEITMNCILKIIKRYCEEVRIALDAEGSFVPSNLGPNHISRDEWLKHNLILARTLLKTEDDELIIIADGKIIKKIFL
jgi:hypothetical protein